MVIIPNVLSSFLDRANNTCWLIFFIFGLTTHCNNHYDKTKKLLDQNIIHFKISKYGLLITKLNINGYTVNTLIDLGDPNTFQISTSFAKKYEIPLEKTGDISSDVQGNQFDLYKGIAAQISIATLTLENVEFLSGEQELEFVSKEVKTKIDAVVGWGFLKQYNLKIDYQQKELLFSKHIIPTKASSIELEFYKKSSYLLLEAKLDTIEAQFILDTGSPYSVLDSTFFSNQHIPHTDIKVRKYLFFSLIFKRINTYFGTKNILIDYYIYDLPELSKIKAIGILGGSFFEKYIVYINPKDEKIAFEPY